MEIFSISANQMKSAINVMTTEAKSYYHVVANNCGDAIVHTFVSLGLKDDVRQGPLIYDRWGHKDQPAIMSPSPNVQLIGLIQNNANVFVTEMLRK